MKTISVPLGAYVTSRRAYARAHRKAVPVVHRTRGLAVTPTIGHVAGFTITHVLTGFAIPSCSGLAFDTALSIVQLLSEVFPWHLVRDVHFFRSLSDEHKDALRGCISSCLEMFVVKPKAHEETG